MSPQRVNVSRAIAEQFWPFNLNDEVVGDGEQEWSYGDALAGRDMLGKLRVSASPNPRSLAARVIREDVIRQFTSLARRVSHRESGAASVREETLWTKANEEISTVLSALRAGIVPPQHYQDLISVAQSFLRESAHAGLRNTLPQRLLLRLHLFNMTYIIGRTEYEEAFRHFIGSRAAPDPELWRSELRRVMETRQWFDQIPQMSSDDYQTMLYSLWLNGEEELHKKFSTMMKLCAGCPERMDALLPLLMIVVSCENLSDQNRLRIQMALYIISAEEFADKASPYAKQLQDYMKYVTMFLGYHFIMEPGSIVIRDGDNEIYDAMGDLIMPRVFSPREYAEKLGDETSSLESRHSLRIPTTKEERDAFEGGLYKFEAVARILRDRREMRERYSLGEAVLEYVESGDPQAQKDLAEKPGAQWWMRIIREVDEEEKKRTSSRSPERPSRRRRTRLASAPSHRRGTHFRTVLRAPRAARFRA